VHESVGGGVESPAVVGVADGNPSLAPVPLSLIFQRCLPEGDDDERHDAAGVDSKERLLWI
jgi:hypothetical protein